MVLLSCTWGLGCGERVLLAGKSGGSEHPLALLSLFALCQLLRWFCVAFCRTVSQRCLFRVLLSKYLELGNFVLMGQGQHHSASRMSHLVFLGVFIMPSHPLFFFNPLPASFFWQSIYETFGGFAVVLEGSCSLAVDRLVLDRNFL